MLNVKIVLSSDGAIERRSWMLHVSPNALFGVFLKWWVFPTNPMGFPTKNDQHFGVWNGGYVPPFEETYIWVLSRRWRYRVNIPVWFGTEAASASTMKCWEMRGVSYWIKIGTKTPYKYAKHTSLRMWVGTFLFRTFWSLRKVNPNHVYDFPLIVQSLRFFFACRESIHQWGLWNYGVEKVQISPIDL